MKDMKTARYSRYLKKSRIAAVLSRLGALIDRRLHVLFLLPGLIVIFGILVYPVSMNFFYSFTDKHLILQRLNFIGFSNYVQVLKDPNFHLAIINTLFFTAGTIVFQVVLGMTTALVLRNSRSAGTSIFRTLLLMPYALPPITVSLMWRWMLNSSFGIVNKILVGMGIMDNPISWLSNISLAMPTAIFINVWWGVSLFTISFIAGFQSIPAEYYEVAAIEGAKGYQTFFAVTLPGIRQILGVILILRIIWVFNSFDILFMLTGGGPLQRTSTLPIYSYFIGWKSQLLGRASSVAIILFMFLLLLMTVYFRISDIESEA